jgi:LSD1 subclass zinc finger protein
MAGLMQWFSVSCPSCAIHLQAKLPEGITSVQCSECRTVFAVQISPTSVAPQPVKKSRKRSKTEKDPTAAPRQLSAYNLFMKEEVAKVKREHPELVHREAFKMVSCRIISPCDTLDPAPQAMTDRSRTDYGARMSCPGC